MRLRTNYRQILVNGTIDKHAYELGALDISLPFPELKRRSDINDRARAADRDPDFSSHIRAGTAGDAVRLARLLHGDQEKPGAENSGDKRS